MNEGDPLKNIIIRITMALVAAIVIVYFFKPITAIAAEYAVCTNCDMGTAALSTAIVFLGVIGIAMYKLMEVFNG